MENKEKLEKITKFAMPFDKRYTDPKRNYGIGSMRIWFVLKGKKGAVQVLIGTSLYLTSVIKEYQAKGKDLLFENKTFTCWDVGYHAYKPQYENQSVCQEECEFLNGKPCYYDGSSLRGDVLGLAELFQEKGEEPIWDFLEEEYKRVFA